MARYLQVKTISGLQVSTAETATFEDSCFPLSGGIKAFYLYATGTARDYDSLTRIKVKKNGGLIWSVNELQHAALIQHYSKKAGPGATAVRWTIPSFYGAAAGMNVGFPAGPISVEHDFDATPSAAGTLECAYLLAQNGITHYPLYIGNAAGIGASATRGGYNISLPGILRGICFPRTTSITRAVVVAGGETILDLSGSLLLEAQELIEGSTVSLNRYVETPLVSAASVSVYLDTDGSFATSDEIAAHVLVPVGG